MPNIPNSAKVLVVGVTAAALAVCAYAFVVQVPMEELRFLVLLTLAVAAARMKLKLPGVESSMSMNLPFILIAIAELNLGQALAVGAVSTYMQMVPHDGEKPRDIQMLFNVCNIVNAVAISSVAAGQAVHISDPAARVLLIVATAAAYFLADTVPVAAIISLTEKLNVVGVWQHIALLSFPYFVLSAGVATIVAVTSHYVGWRAPVLLLPVMYGVYRSLRSTFGYVSERRAKPKMSFYAAAGDD